MKKVLIFLPLIITIIFFWQKQNRPPPDTITINIVGQDYQLEIADNVLSQAKGLSGRNSLCEHCGMLFPYDNDNYHVFWMKDTLISLDIIWLDGEKEIVHLEESVQPEPEKSDNELTQYRPSVPARYVIELAAGQIQELELEIGDRIELPY